MWTLASYNWTLWLITFITLSNLQPFLTKVEKCTKQNLDQLSYNLKRFFSSTSRTMVVWFKGGDFLYELYHIRNHEVLKLDYTHVQFIKPKALFTLQGILFMISSDINFSISVFNHSSLSFGKKQQLNSNFSGAVTKLMAMPLYV